MDDSCKVNILVAKYQSDEAMSLDCILCDMGSNSNHFTVIIFHDPDTGQSFNLCAEHMDRMVTSCLDRHKKELDEENPLWYLTEDKVELER